MPVETAGAEERRFRWLHEGLDAFARPLRGAHTLADQFAEALAGDQPVEKLVQATRTARRKLDKRLESGRDRLLELNSFDAEVAQQWVEQIQAVERNHDLENFLLGVWDQFGVHAEAIDHNDWLISAAPTYHDMFSSVDLPLSAHHYF